MAARFPQAPRCPVCSDRVYAAEEKKFLDKTYHELCFKCTSCKTLLTGGEAVEHDTNPYCKSCHSKEFGPKGFGLALNSYDRSRGQAAPASFSNEASASFATASASTAVRSGLPSSQVNVGSESAASGKFCSSCGEKRGDGAKFCRSVESLERCATKTHPPLSATVATDSKLHTRCA